MTIARNALASVLQIAGGAAIQFIIYRLILNSTGPEGLGLWAIVLSTTAVSRIGDFGISASVTKFVAQRKARGDEAGIPQVIETAAISVTLAFVGMLIPIVPVLTWLFERIFPASSLPLALLLLPYSLASLILGSVAAIFLSSLDGNQRHDIRAAVVLGVQLAYLLLAVVLLPAYGLVGLAWSQLAQAILLLIASWFFLRRIVPGLGFLPTRWRSAVFKEVIRYGAQVQVSTLAMALFEPLTKALLGKFGGLSMAGYYEMARQLVGTMRQLLVSANQVLIPVAANLAERDPDGLKRIYVTNISVLSLAAIPLCALLVAWAPIVSEIWLGSFNEEFTRFMLILAPVWAFNTLAVPAYFAQMGTGRIAWNTFSHVSMGACNAALGFVLGPGLGTTGVMIGMSIAIVAGSLIIIAGFHRDNQIRLRDALPPGTLTLLIAGIACAAAGIALHEATSSLGATLRFAASLLAPPLLLAPALYVHPMRRHASDRILRVLRKD